MIKVALSLWVFLLVMALCGWGVLFSRILAGISRIELTRERDPFPQTVLLGIFSVTALALSLNFIVPLTVYAGCLTLGLGLAFLLLYRHRLALDLPTVGLVVVAILWVVWGMPFDGLFNDAGLYHLQFEQWIALSKALWGLGNIQTRFGFDSMWLMFVSATRVHFHEWLPVWTHAIVADMAMRAIVFCWLLLMFRDAIKVGDKYGLILSASAFFLLTMLLWRMRAAGTDVPANLLAICLWLLVYESLAQNKKNISMLFSAVCIAALLVTFKLSILPLALLALPVLYKQRHDWRFALPVGLLAVSYVLLWLFRNFMLSGCFVYPVVPICLNVPWGVGLEQATYEAWDIITFARQHLGPNVQAEMTREAVSSFSFSWLLVWLKKFPKTYYFHFMAAYFAVGLIASFILRGRFVLQTDKAGFLLSSAACAGLGFVYWLVLGPDPRFSWAVFFVLSMTFIGVGFRNLSVNAVSPLFGQRAVAAGFVALAVFAVINGFLREASIDFEQYRSYGYQGRVYEWVPFEHKGIVFYAPMVECGDRIPCAANDVKALDRLLNTNSVDLSATF